MRMPMKMRVVRGLLVTGVVLGFGSGMFHLAHHHHRHHGPDHLTRVCVDAALGREAPVIGRRDRWVAERCAEHAQGAATP